MICVKHKRKTYWIHIQSRNGFIVPCSSFNAVMCLFLCLLLLVVVTVAVAVAVVVPSVIEVNLIEVKQKIANITKKESSRTEQNRIE